MIQFTTTRALFGALIAAAALSGCATTSDSDAEQALAIVDSPSALNTRQPDWDTPFWERWASQTKAKSNDSGPAFQRRDEPLNNVGVLIEGAPDNADAFLDALREGAPAHGFVIVPSGSLDESLKNTEGCSAPMESESCLNGLAVYPGVRLLVRVAGNGQGGLEATLRDTTGDRSASVPLAAADQHGAATLLDELESRAGSARWSVRAFDGGDGHLYISAGRRNGLDMGTELEVRQPGQAIRAPSGQVVAWRPGEVSGTVKVTQWVGEGMSVVEPVSGTVPGAGDWLTLPRK